MALYIFNNQKLIHSQRSVLKSFQEEVRIETHLTLSTDVTDVINMEKYSSLRRLLRVTAYVFKFIRILRS